MRIYFLTITPFHKYKTTNSLEAGKFVECFGGITQVGLYSEPYDGAPIETVMIA